MEKTITKADYLAQAKSIFTDQISNDFVSNFGMNIWRLTWGFDTVIDYFLTVDPSNASTFTKSLLNGSLDATNGDWWDDYGWDAIASLRAAQLINLDQETQSTLIKNAINCWCYMYGPG